MTEPSSGVASGASFGGGGPRRVGLWRRQVLPPAARVAGCSCLRRSSFIRLAFEKVHKKEIRKRINYVDSYPGGEGVRSTDSPGLSNSIRFCLSFPSV